MSDQHIRQLSSGSAAERRAAIIALARAKDPAAIDALNAVCRTDPDLDLRVLATQAIHTIEQGIRAANPQSKPELPMITPLPGRSSKRNQALGEFYLNAATNYHMQRDRARTLENLGKALQHDSELAHSDYVRNLIEQVIDLEHVAAVALLSDETRLNDLIAQIGGKRKLKRRQTHGAGAESATWARVRIEISVLLLAAIISAALLLFLALKPTQAIFDTYTYRTTARIAEHIADLRATSALLRLGIALLAGTAITLVALLNGTFVHLAAIYTSAGEGTLMYLTRRLARLHIGGLIIGVSTVLILMLLDDPVLRLTMLSLIGVIEIVIFVVLHSILIGEVYDFGPGSGCGALFIAGMAVGGIGAAVGFVLVSVP